MGPRQTYLRPGGRAWAEQQLRDAGYDLSGPTGAVATGIFDAVDHAAEDHPDGTVQQLLPALIKLLAGQPLETSDWAPDKLDNEFHWLPVGPRGIQVGDVVRVRADAYADPQMKPHNGQQGYVSALRNGIYVVYDIMDKSRPQMGVRHKPEALERRVPITSPAPA